MVLLSNIADLTEVILEAKASDLIVLLGMCGKLCFGAGPYNIHTRKATLSSSTWPKQYEVELVDYWSYSCELPNPPSACLWQRNGH